MITVDFKDYLFLIYFHSTFEFFLISGYHAILGRGNLSSIKKNYLDIPEPGCELSFPCSFYDKLRSADSNKLTSLLEDIK